LGEQREKLTESGRRLKEEIGADVRHGESPHKGGQAVGRRI
jgi:hypothetical protein